VKGDSAESLAKPELDARPEQSAERERQLELAWLTGEAPIERQTTPRWTPKVLQPEPDECEELPASAF
jgi:hypothetical protein